MTLHHASYQHKNYGLRAFLWGLFLAAAIVLPVMIMNGGCFLYYGDFNAQQVPFYQLAHDTVLSGDLSWSPLTDLGANFIGSYSFYLLGSPFFLITLLLPSKWVAYAIGPLLILKLACAALSAYLYLRRYTRDRRWAIIGGLLYAFSGFSVYNIFFFHFHEAMIVFPLLLAALDEFHETSRRGVFALAVAFAAITNYYFFFGQVVFVLIYYILRLITRSYRFRLKEFLLLAAEAVIGFMMSLVLILPSIAAITGNYRISEYINGWSAVIYPRTQRYIQILIAFFFPGDLPALANFTPDAGGRWSSVAAYLPLFSMTFVIAYLRQYKKSFFRKLFLILIVIALVPGLNSLFQMLNSTYYARWFYMLTLMMALMTVRSLENMRECDIKKGLIPTAIITAGAALVIGLMPYEAFKSSETTIYKFGIEAAPRTFWVFVLVAVAGLAVTLLLYLIYRKKPRIFFRAAALALSIFIVLYSWTYLFLGKELADADDAFLINYALNGGEDITLPDVKDVRSDFVSDADNMGMYWQIPNIQAFHSIVPGSLMDFYNDSGVQRDVASRPDTDHYGFRALLSVKYLFVQHSGHVDSEAPMPYFSYIATENGFDEYLNECYIPMGFTFDRYICEEEYLNLSGDVKHLALLKALVLSQEQMKKHADITGYTDGMYLELNSQFDENHLQDVDYPQYIGYKSPTQDFVYTPEEYRADVEKRKESCCSEFTYVKGGFDAVFENKGEDNLLFFSVPYDEGWSATINGEPVEIEKVDIGMMAVRAEGKTTSRIAFRYTTPLLKEGIILSLCGLGAFILYLCINRGFRAKRKHRYSYRIKQKTTEI